jgi:hypothetical protein
MSNLAYLGMAAGLSVLGLLTLWLARRRPRSMQAGMEAFSRELQALAPPDARANRQETHVDRVSPAPIRPRPTIPPSAKGRGRASKGIPRYERDGRDGRAVVNHDDGSAYGGHESPGTSPD